MTVFDLIKLFFIPREDHPARKAHMSRRQHGGRVVSGNSKWHRRMVAAGKPNKSPYYDPTK